MKSFFSNTPLVSVIIPTYNRAHCVGEAIESVFNQTFRDFELIVVDDGSTDNTHEVLARYKNAIRAIRQENQGVSAARNAGIKVARGEWIAFLDSDDIWLPDKLKVQMEDIAVHPEVVAHVVDAEISEVPGGNVCVFELRGLRAEFKKRPLRNRPLSDVMRALFFTPCWLLRKSVLETVGCFDVNLTIYEDLNLLTKVALEGPFLVNTFMGAIIRRRGGGAVGLSELHKTSRLLSLNSLVKTYCTLIPDNRLNLAEKRLVKRSLGGVYCEIMALYLEQRQWKKATYALVRSVREDPGFRSIARGLFWVFDRTLWLNPLTHIRKSGFRRSEMYDSS